LRDPLERLRDILEAAAAIQRHVPSNREAFDENELLHGWFVRHLQIIGEAARAVPQDVRDLAPEVPWSKVVGMRNVLVHGHFGIDLDIVWLAATQDVPALTPHIQSLLRRLEEESDA